MNVVRSYAWPIQKRSQLKETSSKTFKEDKMQFIGMFVKFQMIITIVAHIIIHSYLEMQPPFTALVFSYLDSWSWRYVQFNVASSKFPDFVTT